MNYLASIHLDKEPFLTSPNPDFLYRSDQHRSALNRLEIAIRLKRGLSLILADVGMGKTTLSRALMQCFNSEDDQYIIHMILDPSFQSEQEFLIYLTKIFGISPFFRSTIDYKDAIEKYLFRQCVEEKRTVVLLIDEGQKLSQPYLEILRTLLNYETNEYKMLQLVIFAQMELLPKVKMIKNFMDRVSMRCIINPLDEYETGQLISFRLKQAGYAEEKDLFSYEAVKRIFEYSKGYPRRICMICHSAMEQLIIEGHETVTGDLIERIIQRENAWA